MVKYKIERTAGMTMLVVHGQKGQQLSEREYYALKTGQIPGLIHADAVQKSGVVRLSYNISGCISLREFLVHPLNRQSFARLLKNILENLKALQNAYFNQQYILLDLNATMVNPATQDVSFVYVPLAFFESGTNLKDFLLSIIQCCSFLPGENTEYVREYIQILNRGINFSVFDLEEYVKTLCGGAVEQKVKKCTKCGFVLPPNVNFCPSCGLKAGGLSGPLSRGVYDPLKNLSVPPAPVSDASPAPAPSTVPVFGNRFSNTVSNSSEPEPPREEPRTRVRKAKLRQLRTGAETELSSFVRIGKDPFQNEFCIGNNPAVSRCHAMVQSSADGWVLTDLNSTNKTFLNDAPIPPNTAVSLSDGVRIRFANEEFLFTIYETEV